MIGDDDQWSGRWDALQFVGCGAYRDIELAECAAGERDLRIATSGTRIGSSHGREANGLGENGCCGVHADWMSPGSEALRVRRVSHEARRKRSDSQIGSLARVGQLSGWNWRDRTKLRRGRLRRRRTR